MAEVHRRSLTIALAFWLVALSATWLAFVRIVYVPGVDVIVRDETSGAPVAYPVIQVDVVWEYGLIPGFLLALGAQGGSHVPRGGRESTFVVGDARGHAETSGNWRMCVPLFEVYHARADIRAIYHPLCAPVLIDHDAHDHWPRRQSWTVWMTRLSTWAKQLRVEDGGRSLPDVWLYLGGVEMNYFYTGKRDPHTGALTEIRSGIPYDVGAIRREWKAFAREAKTPSQHLQRTWEFIDRIEPELMRARKG